RRLSNLTETGKPHEGTGRRHPSLFLQAQAMGCMPRAISSTRDADTHRAQPSKSLTASSPLATQAASRHFGPGGAMGTARTIPVWDDITAQTADWWRASIPGADCDVVVIGAGIAGLSTALCLL